MSALEDQFAHRWGQLYPDLPPLRGQTIPPWEAWAAERKSLGLARVRRAFVGDFIWPSAQVVVEIQGGTWVVSGHSTGTGIKRDATKLLTAAIGGWLVVPLTAEMMKAESGVWFPKLAGLIRARACEFAKDSSVALAHLP